MAITDVIVQYRDIPGFPGYRVGDDGTAWSAWQSNGKRPRYIGATWRQMSARYQPPPAKLNYPRLRLCKDGIAYDMNVHTLVLLAFCGPPESGQQCRHLNGDPEDNRLQNLKWGTVSENAQDAVDHGTRSYVPHNGVASGEHHPMARLTGRDVKAIRHRFLELQRELSDQYGVTRTSIYRIFLRQQWRDGP